MGHAKNEIFKKYSRLSFSSDINEEKRRPKRWRGFYVKGKSRDLCQKLQ